jgi:hypothetical protein
MLRRRWKWFLAAVVALAAAVQLVPYGRRHTNPPITAEPRWSEPEVRVLAARACFDCHSNETKWPWYSNVAPFSWAVQRDVEAGRRQLNFSEWDKEQKEARHAADEVLEGGMPLPFYRFVHKDSALSLNERHALVSGLRRTLDTAPSVSGKNRGALERWLVQASAELQFGIVQNASARW